jgi:hypothetical protein
MPEHGDYAPDGTLDFKFTTIDSTGLPATLSGSPAVAIYDQNNTTEITAGITLTADFDARTGLNHVRIVGATAGLTHGHDYQVVITAGTVGGVSVVGYVVAQFSCHNRSVHEGIYYGSVTATSTAAAIIDSGAPYTATDAPIGRVLIWLSGTLKGQAGVIGSYNTGTDTFGFDANNDFTGAPANGDRFMVV